MVTSKDYFLIAFIGFLIGLLVLPILHNVRLFSIKISDISFYIVFGFSALAFLLFWLSVFITKKIPVFLQIVKFIAVGGLNTSLDLGILNFFIFISNITAGFGYVIFKSISFILANINSYLWNKFWVFYSSDKKVILEFRKFFTVSIIGFLINVGTATFIVNFIGKPNSVSGELWAIIGGVAAVFFSMLWNFLGYKFFVFKSKIK
jgi:putative flippase GtrA